MKLLDILYNGLVICSLLYFFGITIFLNMQFGNFSYIGIISIIAFALIFFHYVALKVSRVEIINKMKEGEVCTKTSL